MLSFVNGAVRASLVTFVLCGFAYPLAVTGIGQVLMSDQANGSLKKSADGKIIGSRLIGQQWSDALRRQRWI
jgi:K+-transporting ATPase ATPase C chain